MAVWNNYNFGNLFLGAGSASVLNRTQKIFYVCCTRAKEHLAVFFHNPDAQVVAKAKIWFGDDNVIGGFNKFFSITDNQKKKACSHKLPNIKIFQIIIPQGGRTGFGFR